MPTRFLINQCQIITFLILKSDIIESSRIELRGIVLPAPSNQIKLKLHLLFFFFFLFHIEIEGKGWWIICGGWGAQSVCWPLSQIIGEGGGGAGPPLPTPMYMTTRSCSTIMSLCGAKCRIFQGLKN